MTGDTEQLRQRLEAIAEELADLAMDALREALAAGTEKRPEAEKRLTQARRAVEKAAGLLKPREPDAG